MNLIMKNEDNYDEKNSNLNKEEIQNIIGEIVNSFIKRENIENANISLSKEGKTKKEIINTLKYIGSKTPKVNSTKYLAQLFSGKNEIALIADMTTSLFNVPMHTIKSSGIHVDIEKEVINYINQFINFKDGITLPGGSISNLVATIIARYKKDNSSKKGIKETYRIYASKLCHYSIKRAAGITGIGKENLVLISFDEKAIMKPKELEKKIIKDINHGFKPLMLVSTAGTTLLGSYDNLLENSKIAKKYNLWHHVDGAFGGTVLFSQKRKHLIKGIEKCDSFVWDAHKMLSTPISASILLTNNYDLKLLDEDAYYLFTSPEDPGRKTIQCARRNDALKIWAALSLGQSYIENLIEKQIGLAEYTAEKIKNNDNLEIAIQPKLPLILLRHKTKDIYEILTKKGINCGKGRYNNKEWVKISLINKEMTKKDVDTILEFL